MHCILGYAVTPFLTAGYTCVTRQLGIDVDFQECTLLFALALGIEMGIPGV